MMLAAISASGAGISFAATVAESEVRSARKTALEPPRPSGSRSRYRFCWPGCGTQTLSGVKLKPGSNPPDTVRTYAEGAPMAAVARVLLFVALVLSVAGPARAQSEPLRTTILRVDPNQPPARDVYMGVSDSRGLPVTGLEKSAFTLTEDGKPVSIDRLGLENDSQQPLAFAMLI